MSSLVFEKVTPISFESQMLEQWFKDMSNPPSLCLWGLKQCKKEEGTFARGRGSLKVWKICIVVPVIWKCGWINEWINIVCDPYYSNKGGN